MDLSDRLVDLVNHHHCCGGSSEKMQLPRDATEFVKALLGEEEGSDSSASLLLEGGKAKEFVGRAIGLARIALSLSTGECVSI